MTEVETFGRAFRRSQEIRAEQLRLAKLEFTRSHGLRGNAILTLCVEMAFLATQSVVAYDPTQSVGSRLKS